MNHNMIHTEHFAPTVIRTWIFFSNQSVSKNSFQNRVDKLEPISSICRKLNGRETMKLVSKIGFEQEFPFGTSLPEKKKQNCLFRCSVAPGNFPLETRVPFASRLELTECIGNWRAPTLTLTGYSTLRLTYEILLPTCFIVHLFIYIFDFFPSFQKIQKVLVIHQALRTLTPQSCHSVPDP